MPYLYESPGRFRTVVLDHPIDYGDLRWTVDTPQDLDVVRLIYKHFSNRDNFSWSEVLSFYEQQPGLLHMNANVAHNPFNAVDERSKGSN
jgi:spore coat polysaccharide biosynthesis protein SpsF